jgi:hypothetical protein
MRARPNRAKNVPEYRGSLAALDLYSFRHLTVLLETSRQELLDLAAPRDGFISRSASDRMAGLLRKKIGVAKVA